MSDDLSARAEAGFQRRSFTIGDMELRAPDGASTWTFEGIAATVDHPYTVPDRFGEFTETITRGAFDRTLANRNSRVSLFVEHNWRFGGLPLATRKAGTLELVADPHLRVKASLDPRRPDVQTLRSALERGEVSEMSVGYNNTKDGFVWNADYTERSVTEAALREVSITEEGCNDMTSGSIRSLLVDLERSRSTEYDADEIRRAILHLESLLPQDAPVITDADEAVEMVERSGLVVSDALVAWCGRRFAA
jgi:HK97 family phage prohead protease